MIGVAIEEGAEEVQLEVELTLLPEAARGSLAVGGVILGGGHRCRLLAPRG